jgi:AbrB family looped-hinge helix DNA binding protein
MPEAKISSKNQIVVPKEARERLGVKSGDKLLVVVQGKSVYLYPKPKNFEKAIRGLGKGLYGPDYLKKERESWD